MRNGSIILALLAALVVALGTSAQAAIITVPDPLPAGGQYRLAFVTNSKANIKTILMSDYNTFVTDAAEAVSELDALGTTWTCIGSVPGTNAKTNTQTDPDVHGTGVPIYNLAGLLVSADYPNLWDGAIDNPINMTELGNNYYPGGDTYRVATGTNGNGTTHAKSLGGTYSNGQVACANGSNWLVGWGTYDSTRYVYGMSGIIGSSPGGAIPEPSSLVVFGVGLLSLAVFTRRPRRRR